MSQRFAKELHNELPEVDAFIGLDQVSELGTIVERILGKRPTLNIERSTPNADSSTLDVGRSAFGVSDLAFTDTRPTYIPDYDTPRFRLTPAHSAYVKIAEGCNHPCSFCVIPQMRGKHRSRKPESVLAEIRALVDEGVREINLISQDTTYYGMDLWDDQSGAAAAGGFQSRADARRAASRHSTDRRRILGAPALHAPGALER